MNGFQHEALSTEALAKKPAEFFVVIDDEHTIHLFVTSDSDGSSAATSYRRLYKTLYGLTNLYRVHRAQMLQSKSWQKEWIYETNCHLVVGSGVVGCMRCGVCSGGCPGMSPLGWSRLGSSRSASISGTSAGPEQGTAPTDSLLVANRAAGDAFAAARICRRKQRDGCSHCKWKSRRGQSTGDCHTPGLNGRQVSGREGALQSQDLRSCANPR